LPPKDSCFRAKTTGKPGMGKPDTRKTGRRMATISLQLGGRLSVFTLFRTYAGELRNRRLEVPDS